MRISLSWLREYVDLTLSPEDLARRITLATVEVEGIERGHDWTNITVGYVQQVIPHPNSDHLHLATVLTSAGVRQVVCGAPNVAAGQKIAYASLGARLLDSQTRQPRELKAAKIRGTESQGMICSERELGLSDEHEGILELPADAPVGRPLSDVLADTVLVAGAWAHRADLLSMHGIAREVAALTDQRARLPEPAYPAAAGPIDGLVTVDIEATDLCARYVAGVVEGVSIGDAPPWIQERLRAAGQKPINNIVDITNYVMLEYGQPLHAFDYDRIRGHHIIVRRGRSGERLTTLDGVERALTSDMLVIADPAGAVALAGVMGGAESEIHAGTTTVLLEAANFHGTNIRRTSALLGLRSEASSRFEKQLPANLAVRAARRAMQLFVDFCGGRAREGFVDNYPVRQETVRIELKAERLRRVLGVDVSTSDVTRTLRALGFACEWTPPESYAVTVPDWRMDVTIPDDVVEEVIRILGFERLPLTTISGRVPAFLPQPARDLRDKVKDILAAAGAQEIITYSAVSEDLLRKVTPAEDYAILQPLRIVNPISGEHEYMRTSMRGSMLEAVRDNLRLKRPALSFFETAIVFVPSQVRQELPAEHEVLVGAVCGERLDRWGRSSGEPLAFYDAKGYVELLAERLGLGCTYAPATDAIMLDGRTAEVRAGSETLGVVGQVHPDVLAKFGIDSAVFLYEIDLAKVLPRTMNVHRYAPVSRFPSVQQDLAVVVDRNVAAGDLLTAITRSKLVAEVRVFDEYHGDRIPAGKKSLAFAISYQAPGRTLTDAEVAREQERILRSLAHQFGADLRG